MMHSKELRCGPMAKTIVDFDFLLPDGFRLQLHSSGHARAIRYVGMRTGRRIIEQMYLHRLITRAPTGMDVDHINMNKLDNRKCNLRICNRSQNMSNNRKRCVTNVKSTGKWIAQVTVDYKGIYLGTYTTEKMAVEAVESWKKNHRPLTHMNGMHHER